MKHLEDRLPGDSLALLRAVGRAAEESGERAFLVGGVVRDLLLGRPIDDIDVVIEGDVEGLARALHTHGLRAHRVHERFGTATLVAPGGIRLDVARARTESYATPASLPKVAAGTIEQDLGRRDFTINAIAVQLGPEGLRGVLDPHRGRRDLRDRTIRVLHERSFVDDPTRAFRALRFATLLDFRLEPRTARRLRAAMREGGIARLTPARLRKELERACAGSTVRGLARHGLLQAVHPALRFNARVAVRLRRAEAFASRRGPERDWAVALGLLAWDAPRPARQELSARIGADRRVRGVLVDGPEHARRVCARLALPSARRASFVYRVCRTETAEVLLLAASIAPRGPVAARIERFVSDLRHIRTEVRGGDLLRAGIAPGPRVARGLAAARNARLDGRAPDAAAQLRIALAAAGKA